jgi:hypothetical protein
LAGSSVAPLARRNDSQAANTVRLADTHFERPFKITIARSRTEGTGAPEFLRKGVALIEEVPACSTSAA